MTQNFTFCPFHFQISDQEIQALLEEVRSVEAPLWYRDDFRGCNMLPLYNGGGQIGPTKDHHLEFQWSEAGRHCPRTMKLLEERLFPLFSPPGRITVLRTFPRQRLNIHLDCRREEVGTSQYKFRMVLSGEIDRLFFLDDRLERKYVPANQHIYVLDGSHPHGLEPSSQEKITLCMGSPWKGLLNVPDDSVLDRTHALRISRPKDIAPEWVNPRWTRMPP